MKRGIQTDTKLSDLERKAVLPLNSIAGLDAKEKE
jgi:hypothetical protein